jgi:CysZ protein
MDGVLRSPASFVSGLMYPFRALRLINRSPDLWRFVLIPIGINIIVGMFLYATLFVLGFQAIERLVGNFAFAEVVEVVLQAILFVVLLALIGFLLVRFGVVLGSPWYGELSERLEAQLNGVPYSPKKLNVGEALVDIARALLYELKKLLLTLAVAIPLFAANLIPVAGQLIAASGWFMLGVTITCLDFFDPPLERRRYTFRNKIGHVFRMLPTSGGFGVVCFLLVTTPFINLLAIPLCIAAGTMFFCEQTGRTP